MIDRTPARSIFCSDLVATLGGQMWFVTRAHPPIADPTILRGQPFFRLGTAQYDYGAQLVGSRLAKIVPTEGNVSERSEIANSRGSGTWHEDSATEPKHL